MQAGQSCKPAVEIDHVTHQFTDAVVLNAVSFDVPRGTLLAVLGPNGCGKTTLFKILATLLTPTGGAARIGGADVVSDCYRARRQIGVVFQHPSLDDKLTVRENLIHQGHLYGLSGKALANRAAAMLDRFGLADRNRDRVQTLSGGLKRRLEIAKALLHEPEVLILDEPSTGLDPSARAELVDYLIGLRDDEGVTILLTTHLMDEAERSDSVAVIDRGRLVSLDTPKSLKATIGGDVLTIAAPHPKELAGKISDRFGISAAIAQGTVRLEREDGHAFVPALVEAFPGELESVTVGRPTLADVFFHLTGHRLQGSKGVKENEQDE